MAKVRTTSLLEFLEPLGRCKLCGEHVYTKTLLYPRAYLTARGLKIASSPTRCQACHVYEKRHPDMTIEQLVAKRRAADMTLKRAVGSLEWQRRAVCVGADPDLFDEDHPELHSEAQKYCNRCPVLTECGLSAVANNDSGTRGGVYMIKGKVRSPGRYRRMAA